MFDANQYRKTLSENENYLGNSDFNVDSLEWHAAKNGQSVFDKTDELCFQAVIVGNIGSYRFNVGPTGNYISSAYGSLAKAKYQFHVAAPIRSPFREDFYRTFKVLKKLEGDVAVTEKRKDMLSEEGGGRNIRMTKNIFEKRVIPARDSPTPAKRIKREGNREEEETEEMDEKTKNWSVPHEHQDEFDLLKPNYRALPLRVYKDNKFIELVNVVDQLDNTLAEITFSIHHTYIKRNDNAHDSFQAEVEQILILKKRSAVADESTNPRAGPSPIRKRT